MSKTAIDTNVLLASLLSWHVHHEPARRALDQILEEEGEVFVPIPALIEAYSVLTRFPVPHRMSPASAFGLLHGLLGECCRLVGLASEEIWSFLESLASRQVQGKATYDFQILVSAAKAGSDRILSLNSRDFERLKLEGLAVVNPLVGL